MNRTRLFRIMLYAGCLYSLINVGMTIFTNESTLQEIVSLLFVWMLILPALIESSITLRRMRRENQAAMERFQKSITEAYSETVKKENK